MKKIIFLTLIFSLFGAHMELQAQNQNSRILIVYYSKTGNTRAVAEFIHQAVGGDIFELIPARAYPSDYQATVNIARQEHQANARPELTSNVPNISEYDIIFLGYPNWINTMPMFFFTFLESHNLRGKTIIPFCTHGGGGLGRSVADIQRIAAGATVREAFAVRGPNARNSRNDVTAWLRSLGLVR